MKFTLSWLKEHLETEADAKAVAAAMTMAGLEVEEVDDPGQRLLPFSAARIVSAARHPNADRLQVCQVETVDGMKEIVCGAPNARPGLVTIYAPIGAYVPGLKVTLSQKPVRGVVSDGMLCSAAELEQSGESDGILELDPETPIGRPAVEIFGAEPVIDFEVTPNRGDWLGVAGVARDLAAVGLGRLKTTPVAEVPGHFPCPIEVRLSHPEACPVFAGRLIRGVRNGPSPEWLQRRLRAVGLRPISALVDITNLISLDRARPLHVYDAAKLSGGFIAARLGRPGERLEALDGRAYAIDDQMCVIADGSGPIGLGGVMGGISTGCSEETRDVFIESAWFDPLRTAQTSRTTGIVSDAAYRFARCVDPASTRDGLNLATALILDLCGGKPSEIVMAGAAPADPDAFDFDPDYVHRLSGLAIGRDGVLEILHRLGFKTEGAGAVVRVTPPSWRRDVEGPADLVEEAARIVGFDLLPSTPLPEAPRPSSGVLTPLQARVRIARRALAALGCREAVTWSFLPHAVAERFGGGDPSLVLANPIASDLDCMRPSILPNLIAAAARNAARGFAEVALFEIGPVYRGDGPGDQRTAVTVLMTPMAARRWDGASIDPLFELKAMLEDLLTYIGAPASSFSLTQAEASPWMHPGRSARLKLGPKTTVAEFGEIHPGSLALMDAPRPAYGFELILEALPEPRRKAVKTIAPPALSPLMPLGRDFAFLMSRQLPAGDLVRAIEASNRTLIERVRVFDVYAGPGVAEDEVSVAVEVIVQPRQQTLTDEEIEGISQGVVAAAEKLGARLRR